MKTLLLFIFLGFTQVAVSQVRVNLDNQLSVTFPANPTKTKTDAGSYVYSANQNGAFYIATVTNMSKQFDYSTNSDSLQHFYDSQLSNTVKKVNGKIDYKQTTTIGNVKGIEFGYTLDTKNAFPDMRFQRSVYLNKILYSFQFWTFKDKLNANTADKEIFFNTITTPKETAPPAPYQAAANSTTANNAKTPVQKIAEPKPAVNGAGYYAGVILGAFLMAAFLMVILKLIIRTANDKKKTPDNKKKQ